MMIKFKNILFTIAFITFGYSQELFEFNQSSNQAFYFIESAKIGDDDLESNDLIGLFCDGICVGSNNWQGNWTEIPAMGNDGSEWTTGYCNEGDYPTFQIYDYSENQYLLAISSDIISSWSGLRPLIKKEGLNTKELSRKDEISISKSGMITIAGGKLTGYRIMAKKIVDLICKKHNIKKRCISDTIIINGGEFKNLDYEHFKTNISNQLKVLKIESYNSSYLMSNYGNQSNSILEIYKNNNFNHLVEAEVVFCLNNESLYNPLDFFLRRTGKIFFYPEIVLKELEIVMPYFIKYLSIDNNEADQMKENVKNYLKKLTNFSE